ncbi:hypothetical protein [Candidatus Vidania fulgoroideorum]
MPSFIKLKLYYFYYYNNIEPNISIRNSYISLSTLTGSILANKRACLGHIKLLSSNFNSTIVGFGIRYINQVLYFYKHINYIVIGSKIISFLNRDIYAALRFIRYVKTEIKKNW